jgi:hypothetical protein
LGRLCKLRCSNLNPKETPTSSSSFEDARSGPGRTGHIFNGWGMAWRSLGGDSGALLHDLGAGMGGREAVAGFLTRGAGFGGAGTLVSVGTSLVCSSLHNATTIEHHTWKWSMG